MKKIKEFLILGMVLIVSIIMVYNMEKARAEPEGASVEFVSNSTKNTTAPDGRTDDKGYITEVTLSTTQKNIKWKSYVGNVSGTLVLKDADGYSVYEWSSGGDPDGEVYITRNSSIDWESIQCANQTGIGLEQTELGHGVGSSDNINNTFANYLHSAFEVGTTPIDESSCNVTYTWINDTEQTPSTSAYFQEVLLMDDTMAIVYAVLIDQNMYSYKDDAATDNTRYDFQAIVPDYVGASVATYYFYVEIDG
ncbi:hypothetical protein JXC34_03770 [Candidatus Woesearchaeota archaeon]|nr:hypothetical protein [Candidatus Woesearchaeota archaeon]